MTFWWGKRDGGDELDEVRFHQYRYRSGPKTETWKIYWLVHTLERRFGLSIYFRGKFYFFGLMVLTNMRKKEEPAVGEYAVEESET
jgi:hypothetical protein